MTALSFTQLVTLMGTNLSTAYNSIKAAEVFDGRMYGDDLADLTGLRWRYASLLARQQDGAKLIGVTDTTELVKLGATIERFKDQCQEFEQMARKLLATCVEVDNMTDE